MRSVLFSVLVGLLVGCSESTTSSAAGRPPASRQVRDLIAAVTPHPGSATPPERNAWHNRRRDTLERLRNAGEDVGREALDVYAAGLHDSPEAVVGLLDVAAHSAPDAAAPALEALVTTYGPEEAVRSEATRLLAIAAPERAVEVLRPPLLDPLTNKTWPSSEVMLEAWVSAARATSEPLDVLLATVATDIYQQQETRHRAVKELATVSGPRAEQALEEVLIEPTGNAYLRRLAAQSMIASMGERSCPIFERVADREADGSFLHFLIDVLGKNCQ